MKTKIKIILLLLIFSLFSLNFNNVSAVWVLDFTSSDWYKMHVNSDLNHEFKTTKTKKRNIDRFAALNTSLWHWNNRYSTNTEEWINSTCWGRIYAEICKETRYSYGSRWTCTNSSQSRTKSSYKVIKKAGTCSNRTSEATTRTCDSTPPNGSVSYSPDTWTNWDVTITVTCSDPGSWAAQSWCVNNTYTKTVSANWSWNITISDNDWNTNNISYNVTWIDKIPPTGTISYHNGWTNANNLDVIFSLNDNLELDKYTIERRISTNNPIFDSWSSWDYILWKKDKNINWLSTGDLTYNYTTSNNTAYQYRILVSDKAWNTNTITNWSISKIDKTDPIANDIEHDNYDNLLAQIIDYKVTIGVNWWSPIVSIKYQIENNFDENLSWDIPELSSPLSFPWYMTNVDPFKETNWAREYTFKITELCDEATNCYIGDYTKIHNVYANTEELWIFKIGSTSQFTSWVKIADWTNYILKAILADVYWNKIVPATWIYRTIDLNFEWTNTLNENQYDDTLDAVYLNTPNDSAFENRLTWDPFDTTFYELESSDWEYNFNFKVYAPTDIALDLGHDFEITQILVTVDQSDTTSPSNPDIVTRNNLLLNNSNVDFSFLPLYTTAFSWEQTNSWLLVEITQTGWLVSLNERNDTTTSNWQILLNKEWIVEDNFEWVLAIDKSHITDWSDITNTPTNYYSFDNTQIDISKELKLYTQFNMNRLNPPAGLSNDIKELYIYSYLKYEINGNVITYFWDRLWWKETNNAWLKIYWISNIDDSKQRDVTTEQDKDINNLEWNINKSLLRKNIRSNVSDIINNIAIDNDTNVEYGDKKEIWDKYIYFDLSNDSDKIINLNLTNIEDNRTIIIKWGNLYLTCDTSSVICWTSWDNLPWIIVLKDENWIWWKLYIDPEISKIDAIIYLDKSILSYNWDYLEISPNNWGTSALLNKQLYIHGSLFSENTIWWSYLADPICPYYLGYTNNICELDESQKYDLNYLRRWFEDPDDLIDDSLWEYPVIIKYNPKLQINPPAIFSN